ncbi:hypothetical protein [Rhodoblastus sp.]|uniref:hypothetical protein n=1 Tax=Rhodoblastus sp. TaxID=1962975 RepID=UPI003FD74A6C
MKLGLLLGAAAIISLSAMPAALAQEGDGLPDGGGYEFGAPDYPNYLSRVGAVSCNWMYDNYFRACPTPQPPPEEPTAVKAKD